MRGTNSPTNPNLKFSFVEKIPHHLPKPRVNREDRPPFSYASPSVRKTLSSKPPYPSKEPWGPSASGSRRDLTRENVGVLERSNKNPPLFHRVCLARLTSPCRCRIPFPQTYKRKNFFTPDFRKPHLCPQTTSHQIPLPQKLWGFQGDFLESPLGGVQRQSRSERSS